MIPPDKGYVYFQDFIPNNNFDIRIVVIGDKAFAEKRMVRKGDFRASGGGNNLFDRNEIPEECVKVSFEVAEKLQSQSCYFDYVFGADGKPSVVEVSYCSEVRAYDACPGYWSKNMEWHEGKFNPQAWMVQDLVNQAADLRQGGGINYLITSKLSRLFLRKGINVSHKKFDLRVVVIGNKALCEKRYAREGDFRASGSGKFEYVPLRDDVLDVAFRTAKNLGLQSVAFDFIFRDNEPLIVEMSYAFGIHGISHCPGYYTDDHQWHAAAEPDFCGWMVDMMN
jgi:glutathione synthase/RimK-type ligase-like ATP-grasp enzyme